MDDIVFLYIVQIRFLNGVKFKSECYVFLLMQKLNFLLIAVIHFLFKCKHHFLLSYVIHMIVMLLLISTPLKFTVSVSLATDVQLMFYILPGY